MADLARAQTIAGRSTADVAAPRARGGYRRLRRRPRLLDRLPIHRPGARAQPVGSAPPDRHLCPARHGLEHRRRLRRSARSWLRRVLRHWRLHRRLSDIAVVGLCPSRLVPPFFQQFWPALASPSSWPPSSVSCSARRPSACAATTSPSSPSVSARSCRTSSSTPSRSPAARGINPIAKPPTIGTVHFGQTDQRNWYWLILGIGLLSIFMILRLYDSRLGRSWQAIREDEIAAASMGINLTRTKLWAFALGASFSGFAGSLFPRPFSMSTPASSSSPSRSWSWRWSSSAASATSTARSSAAVLIGSFDRILAERLTVPLNALASESAATGLPATMSGRIGTSSSAWPWC